MCAGTHILKRVFLSTACDSAFGRQVGGSARRGQGIVEETSLSTRLPLLNSDEEWGIKPGTT